MPGDGRKPGEKKGPERSLKEAVRTHPDSPKGLIDSERAAREESELEEGKGPGKLTDPVNESERHRE